MALNKKSRCPTCGHHLDDSILTGPENQQAIPAQPGPEPKEEKPKEEKKAVAKRHTAKKAPTKKAPAEPAEVATKETSGSSWTTWEKKF